MATLAELETRIIALEGLLATTKRIRELTLTQTQNPATTLSGGVFSFDGGGFVIPNTADGVDPQDVATVNQTAITGTKTVYVATEADLPPIASVMIAGLGTFDFHVVTTDTQFVWVASPVLTAGISVNPGIKCTITSANKLDAPILFMLSQSDQVFLHASAIQSLRVENAILGEISLSPLQKSWFWTSGAGNFVFRNCQFEGIPSIGNSSQGTATSWDFINCNFKNLTLNGLVMIAPNIPRFLFNTFDYTGSGNLIEYLGVSKVESQVIGNTSNNASGFFLGVQNTLDVDSKIQISSNLVTADTLINSGGGFFTAADKQVISTDNIYNISSRITARLYVNDNTPVTQTGLVVNTPQGILGFTFNVDGTPERFEVTTNIPGSPLLITYKGNKARIAVIFEASIDGTQGDYDAIGIFKNGSPVTNTFIAREQPTAAAQPTFQVTNVGVLIEFNDTLSFGVENQTSAADIILTNPVIFIGSTNPTF